MLTYKAGKCQQKSRVKLISYIILDIKENRLFLPTNILDPNQYGFLKSRASQAVVWVSLLKVIEK